MKDEKYLDIPDFLRNQDNLADEQKVSASLSNDLLETRINIPSIGVGELRTGATWIAVMLMTEDNPAQVIASVMKELKITPQEVHDEYYDEACEKCGLSKLAHRNNNGECF